MTLFRGVLFFLLRYSGLPWLLRAMCQKERVTIITYHDVSPELFEKHLEAFQKRYSIIALKDLLGALQDKSRRLPQRALVITIDDGNKGNFQLLPVIKKYQVPVTVFVCTSIIATRRKFWFNAKVDGYSNQDLKSLPDEERLRLLSEAGFQENKEYDQREALSDEEIRAMADCIDFQPHTRFHVNLPCATQERAHSEIAGSKRELKEKTRQPVYALAYPDGDYSQRDMRLLTESGFKLGLSSDGYYNSLSNDPLALRRLSLRDRSSVDEAIVRASGLWAFIHKLFFGQKYGFKTTI